MDGAPGWEIARDELGLAASVVGPVQERTRSLVKVPQADQIFLGQRVDDLVCGRAVGLILRAFGDEATAGCRAQHRPLERDVRELEPCRANQDFFDWIRPESKCLL